MKKYLILFAVLSILISCSDDDDEVIYNVEFKEEMRNFVIGISQYAKPQNTNFLIIPQNGVELVTQNGEDDGLPHSSYLNAIDGNGQEDLFYGYDNDDEVTPNEDNVYLRAFLDISRSAGNVILVTDYCSTHSNMDDSYNLNNTAGYISFAADDRELNQIPDYPGTIYAENDAVTSSMADVKNFLYLINPENFTSKQNFIDAITATNYDLLIMDLFFHDGTEFSNTEISQLKTKANGGERLLICYMSIGEAEDYRYYWQSEWNNAKPEWIDRENPDWEGNFKVKYWNQEWQDIIFGNNDSYLQKILDAGFDGTYLDIIDAFEYYE